MPHVVELHDRDRIGAFARRDPALHIYEIGDLDPFFWPRCTWLGWADDDGSRLCALALLYAGPDLEVLLAFGRDDGGAIGDLVAAIGGRLPVSLYAHLSPGVVERLDDRYTAQPHGRHLKMVLDDPSRLDDVDTTGVMRLGRRDLPAIETLYRDSYPGNWFDPRMLDTGQYFGIRDDAGALTCIAGVHVFSATQRVAALGNITTHPSHRGRGLARRATARLCRSLLDHVDVVGLNVKADNAPAIACYAGLGFGEVAEYDELMLHARP